MSTVMLEAHKVTLPLEETVLGIACFLVAWFLLLAPGSLDPNVEADFETGRGSCSLGYSSHTAYHSPLTA